MKSSQITEQTFYKLPNGFTSNNRIKSSQTTENSQKVWFNQIKSVPLYTKYQRLWQNINSE